MACHLVFDFAFINSTAYCNSLGIGQCSNQTECTLSHSLFSHFIYITLHPSPPFSPIPSPSPPLSPSLTISPSPPSPLSHPLWPLSPSPPSLPLSPSLTLPPSPPSPPPYLCQFPHHCHAWLMMSSLNLRWVTLSFPFIEFSCWWVFLLMSLSVCVWVCLEISLPVGEFAWRWVCFLNLLELKTAHRTFSIQLISFVIWRKTAPSLIWIKLYYLELSSHWTLISTQEWCIGCGRSTTMW